MDLSPVSPARAARSAPPVWLSHPWGAEQVQPLHPRCQLRHVVLRPGARRAAEGHFHRSERWVVIEGCASVCLGARRLDLHEGGTLDVPAGTLHELANEGRIDLHLLMVETGCHLGEDDRFSG